MADTISQMLAARKAQMTGGKPQADPMYTEGPTDLTEEQRAAAIVEPNPGEEEADASDDSGPGWKGKLGNALQAAGAAIEANVGQVYPGQSFKAGLAKGVVGLGAANAAQARMAQLAAEKEQNREFQQTMLGMRENAINGRQVTPEMAAAKATAVSDAQEPNKEKLANLNAANTEARMAGAINDKTKTATDEDDAKAWATAKDATLKLWDGNMTLKYGGTPEQFSQMFQDMHDQIRGKRPKPAVKPVVKKAPPVTKGL